MSSAEDDLTGPRRDPDLGPTKQTPSVQDRLDQAELAVRATRLKHIRQQSEMVEQANEMTRFPKDAQ